MWYDGVVLIPASVPSEETKPRVAALMEPYFAELRVTPSKRYLGGFVPPDWDERVRMRLHFGVPPDAPLEALLPRVRAWAGCSEGYEPGI